MCTHRRAACGATLAILAIVFTGCGDDMDTPTSPSIVDVSGSIFNNHGHVAVVTADQIRSGRAVALNIRGSADHGHVVELSDGDLVRLRNRERVERDSTAENSHSHRITFN
jgi:hypothetical protein